MKVWRSLSFFVVLILAMLACNLPGGVSGTTDVTATPLIPLITETTVVQNTATATLTPTETAIPFTATPQVSPKLTLTKNSNCRLGPSGNYNVVDQIASGAELSVVGRNEENTWWEVVNATNRECWILAENATSNTDFTTAVIVDEAPPLPGVPQSFFVVNQICQPGPKKFTVNFTWASGGGETAFRLYRNGDRIAEVKASRLDYRDINAPLNKDISYELEAVNENGVSDRAVQIVPACK